MDSQNLQSVRSDESNREKVSDRKQWTFADMRNYSKAVLDVVEIRKQRIVFFVEENFANDEKRKKLLKMLTETVYNPEGKEWRLYE